MGAAKAAPTVEFFTAFTRHLKIDGGLEPRHESFHSFRTVRASHYGFYNLINQGSPCYSLLKIF